MSNRIQILFPSSINNFKQMFFRGYVRRSMTNKITLFITKFDDNEQIMENKNNDELDIIYGYYFNSKQAPFRQISSRKFTSFLTLENTTNDIFIKYLKISGKVVNVEESCIVVFYDYYRIRDSEVKWEYCDNLSELQHLIQSEHSLAPNEINDDTAIKCPSWLSSSMFVHHVINYYKLIKWLITNVKRNRKITIKLGNLILALTMDLLLGYIALQYLTQDKSELSALLMGLLEKLINMLYSLLKWLMGAPAGLKLNNAFNKMLGKYFSYHVQLWWLFLDVSGEKLDTILHIYSYLGYLGFTFQAAVISDMICIATFHSYCIYVYAARMFNLQISGLIALLRFFVGRKYNPLRGTIDSCEYTNQELFVGTVAFTVLLLLLPTTLMYYTVFTLFRVLSLLVQYTLAKLITFVHTLPLYVTVLWLIHSPKVAGNVLMEVINQEKSPLRIRLRLLNKSIFYLVKNFRPPVEVPKPLVWTNFLSNVFIGKQIL